MYNKKSFSMPTFICDRCHSIENTATCMYHTRRHLQKYFGEEFVNNEMICSGCTPKQFLDGKPNKYGGWHNRFHREIATKQYVKEQASDNRLAHSKGLEQVRDGVLPMIRLANVPKVGEIKRVFSSLV